MANGTTSSSRIKYSIVATLIYLRLLTEEEFDSHVLYRCYAYFTSS